jgi:hypothetical protein
LSVVARTKNCQSLPAAKMTSYSVATGYPASFQAGKPPGK